jgi:hypothetical protein
MEQRKQAAPYSCLGQNYCHMLQVKSRANNQRRFVLTPYINQKMYQIEIEAGQSNVPPPDALAFISQISLDGSSQAIAQTSSMTNQSQLPAAQNQNIEVATPPTQAADDGLSAFKKNKSVPPPQPPTTTPILPEKSNTPSKTQTPKSESSSNQNVSEKPITLPNQNMKHLISI